MKPFFCWLDLETSGLDPDKDAILEIAMIVTDRDFKALFVTSLVLNGPFMLHGSQVSFDEFIARRPVNDFVRDMHTKNGLFEEVKKSGVDVGSAERALISELQELGVEKGQLYLAGNTIHFDRSFLRVHMPGFLNFLNYRQVDVSTLKILFQEKYPHPKQDSKHRAMDDVLASIAELKHYLKSFDDELAHAAGG